MVSTSEALSVELPDGIPCRQRTAAKNCDVVVHFACGGKGRAIFNGNSGVTALDAERCAGGDQRGAAVQNRIPCVAIFARQGQVLESTFSTLPLPVMSVAKVKSLP